MRIFESTKNTRTIIEGDLRYIRSDVPTYLSKKERQWLIDIIVKLLDLTMVFSFSRSPLSHIALYQAAQNPLFNSDTKNQEFDTYLSSLMQYSLSTLRMVSIIAWCSFFVP